jgi:tetratricopeptide (TPR) repeat protein
VGNRAVFVVQVIFVVLSAIALYWLKNPGLLRVGIGTDKALSLLRGKDLEYVRNDRYTNGTSVVRAKGRGLKYSFNSQEYNRGWAAFDRSDFTGAELAFRGIVAKTPDETDAALSLGTALYQQGRYQESEGVFRKVLEQDPQFSNTRAALGATLGAQGRYLDAIEQYSLAIGEDPTFALSYYGRGVSYSHVGNRAAAEADLRKTLDLLPAEAGLAAMAREKLATLAKQSDGARN